MPRDMAMTELDTSLPAANEVAWEAPRVKRKSGGTRVLIVDDDRDLVESYKEVLDAAGYQVWAATSGERALGIARAEHPDVVVTDVSMPNMDGFELIRRLKDELGESTPPVVVCSAFDITEREAMLRGAHVFLQKPTSAAALIQSVEALSRGVEPDPEAIASERRIVTQDRRRQAGESDTRLRDVNMGEVAREAQPWIDWLRRYFDCGSAGLFFLEAGTVLPIIAVGSHMSNRPEPKLLHLALAAGIETGTSLVIDDMATHPAFRRVLGERIDIASFAGVPLITTDGVRVGALCIADSFPGRFDADSLTILEYLGRRAVSGLLDEQARPVRGLPQQAPLLVRRTFEMLLAAELRIARRSEHTVEVTIGNLAPGVAPGMFAEQVWRAGARPRLAMGSMGAGLVGLFVRGTAKDAREHVAACLERARAQGLLSAAGIAAVMASSGLSRSAVVQIAESALFVAEAANGGTKVERIVVRTEPGEQVA